MRLLVREEIGMPVAKVALWTSELAYLQACPHVLISSIFRDNAQVATI